MDEASDVSANDVYRRRPMLLWQSGRFGGMSDGGSYYGGASRFRRGDRVIAEERIRWAINELVLITGIFLYIPHSIY